MKWDKATADAANIIANTNVGTWDSDVLRSQWDIAQVMEWAGMDEQALTAEKRTLALWEETLEQQELAQVEHEEVTEELIPFQKMRVLISAPVSRALEIKALIEQLQTIEQIEIDYGAN